MFRAVGGARTVAAAAIAAMAVTPALYSAYTAHTAPSATVGGAVALDPAAFKDFRLVKKDVLSHDSNRYTFSLGSDEAASGLAAASIVLIKAPGREKDGKDAIRPYTPVSAPGQVGTVDIVVKKYPGAAVGTYLDEVKVGSTVAIKGPIFKFKYEPNTWAAVGMIAGGSGITPMYQLIEAILANPRDKTEVRLIYANRTPGDILLKKELDALAATHSNFKVLYTVDTVPAGQEATYTGAKGIVTADMIRSFLPSPEPTHRIFVCGPGGMMNHLSGSKKSPTDQGPLTGLLADLKFTSDNVYKY